jgi:hypothetical protein
LSPARSPHTEGAAEPGEALARDSAAEADRGDSSDLLAQEASSPEAAARPTAAIVARGNLCIFQPSLV